MKGLLFPLACLILLAVTAIEPGCGGTIPADEVTVQLKGRHNAQFAGFYVAEGKGFYSEENIRVTWREMEAGTTEQTLVDLLAGRTAFAVVSAGEVLVARVQGNPIIAIAAIFQRNPLVYASLRSSGIRRPHDFPGKRIMVSPEDMTFHQALLRRLNIDPSLVEMVPYQPGLTSLASGEVDVQMMERSGLAIDLEEAGYELSYIWPQDYGIRSYGDTIVTTEQLIQQRASLIERFLRATINGWRYTIEHQDEAVNMVLQYAPMLDRGCQLRVMRVQSPMIHNGLTPIGFMQDDTWQQMCQSLCDDTALSAAIDIGEVYTNQFLDRIYSMAGR